MKNYSFLFVVLFVSLGVQGNRHSQQERVGAPEDEIDRLAYRNYQEKLRQEQRERQVARHQHQEEQYEEQPRAAHNYASMQGRLFGPAYHRKLGYRYQHGLNDEAGAAGGGDIGAAGAQDYSNHPQYALLSPGVEEEEERGLGDNPSLPQEESELVAPVVKESSDPATGMGQVINADTSDHSQEEEEVGGKVIAEEEVAQPPQVAEAPSSEHPHFPKSAPQLAKSDTDKLTSLHNAANMADVYFLAVVAGCSVAGLIGLVVAGVCWYKLQKNVKAASEAEYPAYGITGPTKERAQSPGDRKLAQSAQMCHYQHQKQQMIAMEKANSEMKQDGSEDDSEEENEEGDYTVYECPGLAPTGEMEVKNPLFSEDTPVTPTVPGTDRK